MPPEARQNEEIKYFEEWSCGVEKELQNIWENVLGVVQKLHKLKQLENQFVDKEELIKNIPENIENSKEHVVNTVNRYIQLQNDVALFKQKILNVLQIKLIYNITEVEKNVEHTKFDNTVYFADCKHDLDTLANFARENDLLLQKINTYSEDINRLEAATLVLRQENIPSLVTHRLKLLKQSFSQLKQKVSQRHIKMEGKFAHEEQFTNNFFNENKIFGLQSKDIPCKQVQLRAVRNLSNNPKFINFALLSFCDHYGLKYVRIQKSTFIYGIRCHSAIPSRNIGLSHIQREELEVNLFTDVEMEPYSQPIPELAFVKLCVDKLDSDEFGASINTYAVKQCFVLHNMDLPVNIGQAILFTHGKITYCAKVINLEAKRTFQNKGDEVKFGIICESTGVEFELCNNICQDNRNATNFSPGAPYDYDADAHLDSFFKTWRFNLESEIAYPGYRSFEARKESYNQAPWGDDNATKLASNGFFYTGVDDVTMCYSCGGMIRDLLSDDDPSGLHAIWYPNCALVSEHKYIPLSLKMHDQKGSTEECKICLVKPVQVLFTSCKHVATCIDCAYAIDKCLICRKNIEARAHVKFH